MGYTFPMPPNDGNPAPGAAMAGRCRPPAVAGLFYPAQAEELRRLVSELLRDAAAATAGANPWRERSRAENPPTPKALIAPHAGYIYSGATAARAYALLAAARTRIRRVVLLGPAHRVALRGIALSACRRFATPLGDIEIDQDSIARLRRLPQVQTLEAAHEQEHSLETHLPFLQLSLDSFRLAPLVVGDADARAVREALEQVWGGDETLIVVSSDLSHYHDYDAAQQRDRATSAAIQAMRAESIGPREACGCMPLRGLLTLARERGLRVEILETVNSGDTAGDRRQVVGYGAYAVFEPPPRRPPPQRMKTAHEDKRMRTRT